MILINGSVYETEKDKLQLILCSVPAVTNGISISALSLSRVSDLDSIRSMDPDSESGSRRAKMHKNKKKIQKSISCF
jgi:hypothetical protein